MGEHPGAYCSPFGPFQRRSLFFFDTERWKAMQFFRRLVLTPQSSRKALIEGVTPR